MEGRLSGVFKDTGSLCHCSDYVTMAKRPGVRMHVVIHITREPVLQLEVTKVLRTDQRGPITKCQNQNMFKHF